MDCGAFGKHVQWNRVNTARLRLFPFVGLVAVSSLGLMSERPPDDARRETQALDRLFAAPTFAVVRDAERVDALPVEMRGEGLSGIPQVVERPVPLDRATRAT